MRTHPSRFFRPDEVLQGGNVRGWMLRAHLLWVLDYGSSSDEQALVWPRLEGFEPDGWYSFASLVNLDRAIAARFAPHCGETAVLEDLGRFSARVNLSMRFAQWDEDDHHRFFEETTTFHSELQDFGRAHYARAGLNRGLMTIADACCFSRIHCVTATGWYEQCLLLHGAIRAVVVEECCRCFGAAQCVYSLRWR